jgi:deoxyribodipyrimidine photolyase
MSSVRTAIHWFRRDLRLSDNTALHRAVSEAETVVPVYLARGARLDGAGEAGVSVRVPAVA